METKGHVLILTYVYFGPIPLLVSLSIVFTYTVLA